MILHIIHSHTYRDMNATYTNLIIQRWNVVQHELVPMLIDEMGTLTPKLEKVHYTLESVRIEEFTGSNWQGIGRPPCERAWLANAFVAKAVLGFTTTSALIERPTIDCRDCPSKGANVRPPARHPPSPNPLLGAS